MTTPPPAPPAGGSVPQPGGLDSEARAWGVAAHLSAFAGVWVFGLSVLGPLVVYLLGRDRHPSIAHHAREALNFNITLLLVAVVGGLAAVLVTVLTLGLGLLVVVPVAAAIGVAWLVLVIVASVRAWDGEPYRYPFTVRFIR